MGAKPVGPEQRLISYADGLGTLQRGQRLAWLAVWQLLFRPSPARWHGWRRLLLRAFGADLAGDAHIYPSVRIWAPWNLSMAQGSCLGPSVECYCVDAVTLEVGAVVSQHAYLCTASHDISDPKFRLQTAPIRIGAYAWVAAGAFVGPGVAVGEGAVLGARACVFKSVKPWVVMGGNPAKAIGKRRLRKAARR
jgi:putative colanic acid biosynthesis acetyltransferase WcaF